MTEPPRRDEVIELLNRLGSDQDEDVLEAAREVHARITAAGTTWDELLVPDGAAADDTDDDTDDDADDTDDDDDDTDDDDDDTDDDTGDDTGDDDTGDDDTGDDDTGDDDTGDDDTGDDEFPDPEDATTRPAGAAGAKYADSIALIDKLLAKSDITSDMREELEGYKTDIAAGEFDTRDRRYLSAVYKRLSKRR